MYWSQTESSKWSLESLLNHLGHPFIYNSEKTRNQINADRLANATRLGEKCLDLTCEVCEDIGMLDIVEEFEQWPESLDAEADDIPVEVVSRPVEVVSRPSYAEAARVRNVSFAEEMRVREEEARRLAELSTLLWRSNVLRRSRGLSARWKARTHVLSWSNRIRR